MNVSGLHKTLAECMSNHRAHGEVKVPTVDLIIAGFVCKSVSTENNERDKYASWRPQFATIFKESEDEATQGMAKHNTELAKYTTSFHQT
eukprot:4905149-Amphidinium_carterae.1